MISWTDTDGTWLTLIKSNDPEGRILFGQADLTDLASVFRVLTNEQRNELGNILIEGLGDASWKSWEALRAERDYYAQEASRLRQVTGGATDHMLLERWRDWSRQMHAELGISRADVLPDDTKGRLELAERLRAGVVAAEAVTALRAERNQLAHECSLLAKGLMVTGAGKHPYLTPLRPVIERHYRPGEPEPNT